MTFKKIELLALSIALILMGGLFTSAYQKDQQAKKAPRLDSSYQIIIQENEYVLIDGNRIVGVLPQSGALDSLVMADNE